MDFTAARSSAAARKSARARFSSLGQRMSAACVRTAARFSTTLSVCASFSVSSSSASALRSSPLRACASCLACGACAAAVVESTSRQNVSALSGSRSGMGQLLSNGLPGPWRAGDSGSRQPCFGRIVHENSRQKADGSRQLQRRSSGCDRIAVRTTRGGRTRLHSALVRLTKSWSRQARKKDVCQTGYRVEGAPRCPGRR